MRAFVHITDFYVRNVKNYGPKNPSKNEKTFFNPFDLKKVKTPPQYWFHISKNLGKAFQHRYAAPYGNKEEF